MKLVGKDYITNIANTRTFDDIFVFYKSNTYKESSKRQIIYLGDLLSHYKNKDLEKKISEKPAIYSNIYSADDELKIFTNLFDSALKNKQKTHIVGVTLAEEIELLEKYYEELGFLREDINCFRVDFSVPLVTVSANIENLVWKGSDYKRMKNKIFFIPPVRESSQNKALFKGINRGVIAGIHCQNFGENEKQFLTDCTKQEKILPLTMGKVLFYNLNDIGIVSESEKIEIQY